MSELRHAVRRMSGRVLDEHGGIVWCLAVMALVPWVTVVGYETVGHRHDAGGLAALGGWRRWGARTVAGFVLLQIAELCTLTTWST